LEDEEFKWKDINEHKRSKSSRNKTWVKQDTKAKRHRFLRRMVHCQTDSSWDRFGRQISRYFPQPDSIWDVSRLWQRLLDLFFCSFHGLAYRPSWRCEGTKIKRDFAQFPWEWWGSRRFFQNHEYWCGPEPSNIFWS